MGKLFTSVMIGLLCLLGSTTYSQVTFTMGSQTASQGQQVCLPVTVSGFNNIVGFQFSINYNPAQLQFVSVGSYNLSGLTNANFGTPASTPPTQAGFITSSWIDPNVSGVTINNGTAIFQVCFTVVGTTNATVSFSSNPTAIEFTNGNGQIVPFSSNPGTVTVGGGGNGGGNNLTLAIQDATAQQGQQVCLDVTVANFTSIVGAQFSINYNPSHLQFVSVGSFGLPGLAGANFGTPTGTPPTQAGVITFSWVDPNVTGVTVNNGTVIFEVCFNVTGNTNTTVSVANTPTAIEFTNSSDMAVPVTTDNGTITVSGGNSGGGNNGGGGNGGTPTFTGFGLVIDDATAQQGQQVCVDVLAYEFTNIVGMQFTIAYDPAKLQFVSVGSFGLPGLAGANFGTPNGTPPTATGKVTFSWVDPNVSGVTVADSTVIFQLCFTALSDACTDVMFSNTPTAIEVTDGNGNVVPFQSDSGTIGADCGGSTGGGGGGGGGNGGTPTFTGFGLVIDDATAQQGQQVCVDVLAYEFTNIVGMQFTIAYDPAKLQFVSVGSFGLPGLAGANFGTPNGTPPTAAGKVTFSWVDPNVSGVTVADSTVIFQLCFTALSNACTDVMFSNTPTAIEVTDGNGNVVPFQSDSGTIGADCGGSTGGGGGNGSDPTFSGFGLVIADTDAQQGQQVCVDVLAYEFTNIVGAQFTITYDPTDLQFVSVGSFGLPGLAGANFGTPNGTPPTMTGKITFSWVDPNVTGVTVPDSTVIFQLCFTALTGDCSDIAFSNTPTAIEITDGNGDVVPFQSDSGTVGTDCGGTNMGDPPTITNAMVTNILCRGDDDGEIVLTVGGAGPFTYTWSDNAIGNTNHATDLSAANYSVTVSDPFGRTATGTYTITEPATSVSVSVAQVHDACFGVNNGSISVTAAGGAGGYTYAWVPPGQPATAMITGLGANFYRVTVTDASGCKAISNFIQIQQLPQLVVNGTVQDVNCAGGGNNNGSITLSLTGGNGSYTSINWSGSLMDNVSGQSNLAAGTYSVTVTDSNGCTGNNSFTVDPAGNIISINSATPSNITNGNDGSINITVGNGTAPYTYHWTGPNNQTFSTEDLSGLNAPGQYCVTVTDNAGSCPANTCVTLGENVRIATFQITKSCNGASNGAVNITPSGGTPPYTFVWRNQATNMVVAMTEDVSGLAAGTYTVLVTDSQGQQISGTFDIASLPAITIQGTTGSSTSGSNGSVTLTVSGGQPGYTYHWSNNASTQNISGLAAGDFCVTVTDANGCTANQCFTVSATPFAITNLTPASTTCNGGDDGTLTVEVEGGTVPYILVINGETYNSSNGVFNIVDLPAGDLSFTITDGQGTVINDDVTIPEPDPMTVSPVVVHDTEDVGCTGSITLNIEGGTEPYMVQWNTSAISPQIINLCDGIFIPQITDANGCVMTLTEGIVVNTFAESATVGNAICAGDSNGSVDLTVTGGEGPYTFMWRLKGNSQVIATTEDLSGVAPGTYVVTIIEESGNTLTREYIVGAQSNVTASATAASNYNGFAVSCADAANGLLVASATGGEPTYTYEWEKEGVLVGTGQQLHNAAAGEYQLTVIDGLNCETTTTFLATAPPAIQIQANVVDALCPGDKNGSILAVASGGAANAYSFAWSNNFVGPSLTFLTPGAYTVTVTDMNACTNTASFEVGEPDPIAVQVVTEPATDGCNGTARAVVTGGSGSYIYHWLNAPAASNSALITQLCPGDYFVDVADSNGCQSSNGTITGNVADRRFPCLDERVVITPDGNGTNDQFIIFCIGDLPDNHLEIYNRWGQLVYETDNYDNTWEGTTKSGDPLPDGPYYFILEYRGPDGKLIQEKGSITLLRE